MWVDFFVGSLIVGVRVQFAVHPIHCEAVTGLVGRADVLACLLVLLALVVYLPATNSQVLVLAPIARPCRSNSVAVAHQA